MRDFGQGIVLVHELGQLRGTEKFLDRCRHRLGIDELLRHQVFGFSQGQALFHRTLDPYQANSELVFRHFTHGTDTAVTQVVDVIDAAATVSDIDQDLQHFNDIFVTQRTRAGDFFAANATIELHAANGGQVVTLVIEEQIIEQVFRGILGWRLTRAHHAIDFHLRFQLGGGRIDIQGPGDIRAMIQVIGENGLELFEFKLLQLSEHLFANRGVSSDRHFTGAFINHIVRQYFAVQVFTGHIEGFHPRIFKLTDVTGGNATALFHDGLALNDDIKARRFTPQTLRNEVQSNAVFGKAEGVLFKKQIQDLLGVETQRLEQDRYRQLAATVDTGKQAILWVVLKIKPGTTVRDHPRIE